MNRKMWFQTIDRAKAPWEIQSKKAALLVIDLQNDFVEEGAILEVPETRKQIPKIKKLIKTCRKPKIPVIYTVMVHDSPDVALRHYDLFPFLRGKAYKPGSRGVQIYDEIAPEKGDIVVEKSQYSAFFNTELDKVLNNFKNQGRTIDTLIIVGTVMNICVESTVRDAFYRNYKVVVISDCCSGVDPELHNASLKNIEYGFGRVMSHKQITATLTQGK